MKSYISSGMRNIGRLGKVAALSLPLIAFSYTAKADTPTQKGIKAGYDHFWPFPLHQQDGTFSTYYNGQAYFIDFTAYQSQGGAEGTEHPLPNVNGMLARGDMTALTQQEKDAMDAAVVRYLELAGIDSTTAHWTTLNWLSQELPTSGVPDDEPQTRNSTWGRVKSLYRE